MKPDPGAVSQARQLRRNMTPPELRLWTALRQRPAGLKFRRQRPAGRVAIDFFCREAGLAIEIDGEAHNRGDRPARDERRDAWLEGHQVKALRIPAREVLANLDGVVRLIVAKALERAPPPRRVAARSPSPPNGGEENPC